MQNLLFLFLFALSPAQATQIFLPEDEIILPPLLSDIVSSGDPEDRFNVTGIDHTKRQAKKGEWLDYGDSLNLAGRFSFQVIQRESIQWVGGGVFEGEIGTSNTAKTDFTYDVKVTRGWIKLWVKPDESHSSVRVLTDSGTFLAKDAIFWLSARIGRTEIYLVQGELINQANGSSISSRNYAVFEKGKPDPLYLSKDWDLAATEAKIAAGYPNLVKLASHAQEQWEGDQVEHIYRDHRKKGWRKASRFNPLSK